VTLRRGREVDLSIEREFLDGEGVPRKLRVAARFTNESGDRPPTPEELAAAFRELDRDLEAARTGAGYRGPAPRSDRSRAELLETYRPRQPELVEALLADGEVTEREAEILRAALPPSRPRPSTPTSAPPRAPIPETDRPLAAMPLSNDRTPTTPRPVAELLATFQIGSLKQAGAIRARRQISYDEYMALKRHFGASDPAAGSTA
jgi:hypothetical protein